MARCAKIKPTDTRSASFRCLSFIHLYFANCYKTINNDVNKMTEKMKMRGKKCGEYVRAAGVENLWRNACASVPVCRFVSLLRHVHARQIQIICNIIFCLTLPTCGGCRYSESGTRHIQKQKQKTSRKVQCARCACERTFCDSRLPFFVWH